MAADASSLHCPNCGAAVRHESGRCPYCQARLATASCPSCFALMFAGAKYCQKCGAARTRAEEDDTAIACPGCRRELRRIAIGGAAMLECGGCDGIWIDADVFERICADSEAQAAVLHRFAALTRGPEAVRVQYRPCPRCFKMMNRVNFGKLSGAVVDVCKGHGTFLDAGELHQIVTFIAQGGLDRARARQIEDMRDEQRKLADAQRKELRDRASHAAPRQTAGDSGALADLIDLLRGDP